MIEILQINSPSSPTANDGSIEAQVSDPNHPPLYDVYVDGVFNQQSPLNIFTIEGLPVGIYQIQAFDGNGCPSEIISVEVEFPGPLLRWAVNVQSTTAVLPDLYFSGKIEHPSKEMWRPTSFITRSSQVFAWQKPLVKNTFWETTLSRQTGTAIYENGNAPDFHLVNLLLFTAHERLFHQYTIGGATLKFGGGMYQRYFDIEKEQRGLVVKDPFQWGLSISGRLEFKLGNHLTYALPLSVLRNQKGSLEFNSSAAFYFDVSSD